MSKPGDKEGGEWLAVVARIGFAARGLIHLIIGWYAAAAAWRNGQPADTQGALSGVSRQSGPVLVWLLAAGLLAFAAWRLAEAAWDPEHLSRKRTGFIIRIARAGAGLVYLASGVLAVQSAWQRAKPANPGDASAKSWAAWVVTLPGGTIVLAMVGAVLLAVGIAQVVKAVHANFRVLEADAPAPTFLRTIGRIGFATRGMVFAIVAWFVLSAAFFGHPQEAGGLGQALRSLESQSYGNALLFAVAAGLVLFGLFSFAEAAFFRISAAEGSTRAFTRSAVLRSG